MEQINIALVFTAGLLSVLSPCVLPILPIIVTGGTNDHKLRPLLIVSGISIAFMLMGALSALFGSAIGSAMYSLEKIGGGLILIMGLLLTININPFKNIGLFAKLAEKSNGRINGFLLGLILGVIWIPCVGPILGSVLTMVASKGAVVTGVLYLLVYSIGFSIPMLLAGYATQLFRSKLKLFYSNSKLIRILSGIILALLGLFIIFKGMIGFSTISL